MSASLRIVAPAESAVGPGRGPAARIRELQSEARALAAGQVGQLLASLAHTERLAREVADGGEAYPPGVRDLARRLVEESAAKARTIEAVMARTPAG